MLKDKNVVRLTLCCPLREAVPVIVERLNNAPDTAKVIGRSPEQRVEVLIWTDSAYFAAKRAAMNKVRDRLGGIPYEVVSAIRVEASPKARTERQDLLCIAGCVAIVVLAVLVVGKRWIHEAGPGILVLGTFAVCIPVLGERIRAGNRRRWDAWLAAFVLLAICAGAATMMRFAYGPRQWMVGMAVAIGAIGWVLAVGRSGGRRVLEISLAAIPVMMAAAVRLGELMWRAVLDALGVPAMAMSTDWFDQLYVAWSAVVMGTLGVFVWGGLRGWWRYLAVPSFGRLIDLLLAASAALLLVVSAPQSAISDSTAEFVRVRAELKERQDIGGVLSSHLHWVCASPQPESAKSAVGGVDLERFDRPLIQIDTGDDRIWLWDPSRPEKSGRRNLAVGYRADTIRVESLAALGVTPNGRCPSA